MTEKELTYIAKMDRRMLPYRIWIIGLSLVLLLSFIVMAIDPILGVIMAFVWLGIFAFYVVIYAVKLKQVKAAIKKELIAAQQAQARQRLILMS